MANQRPLVTDGGRTRRLADGDTVSTVPAIPGAGFAALVSGTGLTMGVQSNGGTPEGLLSWLVSSAVYAAIYASTGLNVDVAGNDIIFRRGGLEKARITTNGITRESLSRDVQGAAALGLYGGCT